MPTSASAGRRASRILAAIVAATAIGPILAHGSRPEQVPYPEDFRSWAHVKTALVSASHPDFNRAGGFRHIYANPAAIAGYRSGTFADGSIIVVDWLEGRDDKGAFTEGARQRVDVMVKDRTRFAATGGWGFERFRGDSRTERTVTSAAEQCYACHAKAGEMDSVYSRLRE
jgi:Cytochrome P460